MNIHPTVSTPRASSIGYALLVAFIALTAPLGHGLTYASKLTVNPTPSLQLTSTRSVLSFPINDARHCEKLEVINQPESSQSILQINTATRKGAEAVKTNGTMEDRNIRGYYAESAPELGRFQLFIKHATPYTVEAQCFNSTLQVTIQERYTQVEVSKDVAKGLKYRQYKVALEAGKAFRTHNLEWDPKGTNAKLAALMPNTNGLVGLKPTYQTLQQYGGLAGMNASFFNHILKIPLGIVVRDGELLNGTLFNRVAFGLDADNTPHMSHVDLVGTLTKGGWKQRIDIVNMPRISASQVALYTSQWGSQSPPAGGDAMAVLLRNGHVETISTSGAIPIRDSDDWVLFGSKTNLGELAQATREESIDVRLSTTPDWSDKQLIVAGGPQLLKSGRVDVTLEKEQFNALPPNSLRPRTAIGIHPNQHVLLMVVDSNPRGASLPETAELLRLFGAVDGMNLDGGSSSQLVVGNEVRFAAVGKTGAPVSTSLGFLPIVPLP
jgi:exopolysaccharide biosynthesis protein